MSPSPRIALITGGGTGIGRASALALSKAGYTVVVCGRRQASLDDVAKTCTSNSLAIAADVTDPTSVENLFATIKTTFGRLDVLFNNAGIGAMMTPIEDLPFERWRAVLDTNVTGTFLCLQAAFRLMREQKPRGGRIINNGSLSAITPRPHAIAYTASKHAVTGLTKAASLEGRKYDIACSQIDIGPAATDGQFNEFLQADLSTKVEPTFDVRHVAEAVVFIANLPLDANVQFMSLMAAKTPFIGRG